MLRVLCTNTHVSIIVSKEYLQKKNSPPFQILSIKQKYKMCISVYLCLENNTKTYKRESSNYSYFILRVR